MLNQVIVVGRLTKEIEMKEVEDKKVGYISLAVPRSFKNADGEYETDFIDFVLYNSIAENTAEYCKKGDIVGIKGRVQTEIIDDIKQTNLIAEKVTFLSSKKND